MKKQEKRRVVYAYCNQFALSECEKCLLYKKWTGDTTEEKDCRAIERASEKELDQAIAIINGKPVENDRWNVDSKDEQIAVTDYKWFMPGYAGGVTINV